jgi:hypothetical protein
MCKALLHKALGSALLSLLLATVLVWGGCVSCEQFFMWPQAKTCCTADGHCKTKAPVKQSSTTECKQIAFDQNQSFDLHCTLPVVSGSFKSMVPPVFSVPFSERPDQACAQARATGSPPDLQILYSSFIV